MQVLHLFFFSNGMSYHDETKEAEPFRTYLGRHEPEARGAARGLLCTSNFLILRMAAVDIPGFLSECKSDT